MSPSAAPTDLLRRTAKRRTGVVTGPEIRDLVNAKGTLTAAARAIGVDPAELTLVLADKHPSWPRLRRLLAAYLGVDRAELFPDFAAWDEAYDAGLARRGDRQLPPEVVDRVVAMYGDVRRPPRARLA